MSIFHYKAQLIEKSPDGSFTYRFFPDCVMAPDVSGVFSVKPGDWEPTIVTPADAEEKGLVSTDIRCVLGLTAKIKSIFTAQGEMPVETLRIS